MYNRWSGEEEPNKDYQFFVHISSYVNLIAHKHGIQPARLIKQRKYTTIKLHCLTINTRSCMTFLMYCHLNCCNL